MNEFNKKNLSINIDSLSGYDRESFINKYKGRYNGDIKALWEEIKPLISVRKVIKQDRKLDNGKGNEGRSKRSRSTKSNSKAKQNPII